MKARGGMLATGLLLLAAGTRAWGAESEEAAPDGTPAPAAAEEAAKGAAAEGAAALQPAVPGDSVPGDSVPVDRVPVVAARKPSGAGEARKIEREIQGAFASDADLKNNRIMVTVDNCNTDAYSTNCYVTLAGAVDNQGERMKAEQVARVKGVVIIDNRLDLGNDAREGVADGAVTAGVREQLLSDAAFKNAIISISTSKGVVRLVGTVPSEAARRLAGEKARQSRAVKRVENALRVERPRQPAGRQTAVIQTPGVATASDRP